MLNLTKKAVSLLLIFILITMTAACTYETRIDFSELIRRMNSANDTYEAELREAFFSEEEWFLFVDTLSDSDILITGKEDEDKILTSVTLSIINNGNESQREIFSDFCQRAVKAFTENHDSDKIIADSGITNTDSFFTDGAYFSENGRFATSLFTAEPGCTFTIEIIIPERKG